MAFRDLACPEASTPRMSRPANTMHARDGHATTADACCEPH